MQSSILKSYFNYITIVLIHWQVLVICFTINIARWKILFSKLLCKIEIEFSFLNTIERDGEEIALASWIARVFLSSPSLCPYFCLVITSFLSGVRIGSPLTSQFVSCSSKSGHVRHVFHHNGTAPDPDGVIINILSKLRTSNFSHDNSTYISFQFLFFPFRNNR